VTGGHATGGCCDAHHKPRSHDTSRIAWAKLLARVGEGFRVGAFGLLEWKGRRLLRRSRKD